MRSTLFVLSMAGLLGLAVAANACGPKSTAVLDAAIDCTTQARADLVAAFEPTVMAGLDKIKDPTTGTITTAALQSLFGKPSLTSEAGVIVGCVESKIAQLLAALLPTGQAPKAALTSTGAAVDVPSLRKAIAETFPGASFKVQP